MGMDSVLKVSLVLDMIDHLSDKAGNVNGSLGTMTKSFDTMQKAGTAMAGVGTGILSSCAGAVTATFDTQNALGELASLGVEDLQAIESAAKDFSDNWAGTTKADFITASYDIKSGIASLTDEGIAQFTELAALTGKATKSTTETMGSLFATGYGIYKGYYDDMSDLEFGEMFSAGIATAVKNYKTSGSEMASAISALGATATNNNVPLEEQLAILGQLQTTMSGSEAATKYKSFLNTAASAGQKLGLTFLDTNNQLMSMPDILEQLRGKYGDTLDAMEKQELKEAFGTDEAIALIDLLYQNTDQLKSGIDDVSASMSQGVSATEDMANAINNTPEQKFVKIKQKLHNVTEELGNGLLPTVNNAMDTVANVIQKGSDWVAANQDTVASIMHIIMYLGIFLVASGSLIAILGTVGKTMSGLGSIFSVVQKLFSGSGFLAALGPFALIAASVVGLIALFKACGGDVSNLQGIFYTIFPQVVSVVQNVLQSIGTYLPGFLQFGINLTLNIINGILNGLPGVLTMGGQIIAFLLSGITQMLPGILSAATQVVTVFLSMLVSALPGILTAGVQMAVMVLNGISQALPTIAQAGIMVILNLLSGLIQNIPSLAAAGVSLIAALLSGISQVLPNLISGGLAIIGNIISGILQAVPMLLGMIPDLFSTVGQVILDIDWKGIGSDLINGIKDGFMKGFENLVDSVKGAWGKFKDWLSGGGNTEEEVVEKVTAASPTTGSNPKTTASYNLPESTVPTIVNTPDISFDTSKYQVSGLEGMQAFADGIQLGESDVQSALDKTAGTSMDELMNSLAGADLSGAHNVGNNIMESVSTGMSENSSSAVNTAQDVISQAMTATSAGGTGTILQMDVDTSGIQKADGVVNSTVGSAKSGINEMQSAWESGMSRIAGTVSSGMARVKSTVTTQASQAAAAIRSAFSGISVTVPAPKLPHVSVSYSTVGSGKATASVPNFSVSYHAEGGIMTRPMMFAMNGSTGHVGGEAGDEAILPLTTLWERMKVVVSEVMEKRQSRNGKKNDKTVKDAFLFKESSKGKGGNTYNRYVTNMNIAMSEIDSLKKLKKLLDELEMPQDEPEPA